MFDVPFDAPPVFVALSIVAMTTFAVATAVAPSPPSDAPALAAAVDRVAASRVPTAASHGTGADAIKIQPRRLQTRTAGTEHASTFATGRVTPVRPETRVSRVLHGADPAAVFGSPVDLELACKRARDADQDWHHDPDAIHVRHVTWGDLDVTLVGV